MLPLFSGASLGPSRSSFKLLLPQSTPTLIGITAGPIKPISTFSLTVGSNIAGAKLHFLGRSFKMSGMPEALHPLQRLERFMFCFFSNIRIDNSQLSQEVLLGDRCCIKETETLNTAHTFSKAFLLYPYSIRKGSNSQSVLSF